MIVDNCDEMISKNLEEFTKQLNECSLRLKLIIITHFNPRLKLSESVINYIQLMPLKKEDAEQIIRHHIST